MINLLPSWDINDVDELRRFARIRLIAVDLDGTLVPADDLLQTIKALRRSLRHSRYNVSVILATGRTLAGVQPLLEQISLPKESKEGPLVLYNGSVIVTERSFRLLRAKTIPLNCVQQVLQISSKHDARALAYFYRESLFARDGRSNEHVIAWGKKSRTFREFNGMPVKWRTPASPGKISEPASMLVYTSEAQGSLQELNHELQQVDGISATSSGFNYIEIRPGESNKGAALEFVAGSYGLNRDEVLALGDNDNDSEMLRWAGIGVSIANASPAAISKSDYLCRHGVFEGTVEVLRLVKHAKHYFYRPRRSGIALRKDEPHRRLA